MNLPEEIWEIILEKLMISCPRSFIILVKVCPQWLQPAARLCRKACMMCMERSAMRHLFETRVTLLTTLNENEIVEPELSNEAWIDIYILNEQTRITERDGCFQQMETAYRTNVVVTEPLFVTYSSSNNNTNPEENQLTTIKIFNSQKEIVPPEGINSNNFCTIFKNNFSIIQIPHRVLDILVMIIGIPVLIIKLPNQLLAYAVNLKPGEIISSSDSHFIEIINCHEVLSAVQISSEWKFLLTVDNLSDGSHTLHQADFNRNFKDINLKILLKFSLNFPIFSSKLFRRHIKVANKNGYINIYRLPIGENSTRTTFQELWDKSFEAHHDGRDNSLSHSGSSHIEMENVELVATSNFSKDLRYPNVIAFTNDWCFSSMSISGCLLSYWHMNYGREYTWLFSDVSSFSCDDERDRLKNIVNQTFKLRNLTLGVQESWLVTAVDEVRGLLICGTSKGCVLVFNLKLLNKEEFRQEFIQDDALSMSKVTDRKIVFVKCLCTSLGILIGASDDEGTLTIVIIPLIKEGLLMTPKAGPYF